MSIMSIESQEVDENEDDGQQPKTQAEIYAAYTERINYFHDKYVNSELKNDYAYISPEVTPLTDADRDDGQVAWLYQLGLLIRRNFLNLIRLPQTSYVKLIVTIVTACFTIILFSNINETLQGVQNRNGALFFITMTISFNSI